MEKQDIDDLFDLLALFRPGDRHLEDAKLRSLWALVLEPYGKDDVRQAVAAYFRECKYWPDVTDISTRCPPMPPPQAASLSQRQQEEVAWMRKFYAEVILPSHRAAGVPTLSEALTQGMTAADRMCKEAGL